MKNNILRIVKMTALYSFWGILLQTLIVSLLFASSPAEGQNLRDIKVTVKAINVSFQEALQIIEQKTDFKFNYVKDEIALKENVTISVTDESLYNILEVFAQDYGLLFNRINNQITIKKAEGWEKEKITSAPEPGTITGSVKEARKNVPIPGANVFVMGLNIGAAADLEGNYTIKNVPSGNYNLRISAVGYGKIQQRIVVESGKTTEANFVLDEEAIGLDEVVVSGAAFETTRKEIPASITIMTSKEIEKSNIFYFADLLKGTIPGVISTSSGGLFTDNSSINIRGSLLSGGDYAKVYIDGIEVSNTTFLAALDVNSIERIEVIRGPHASAMYGANATSGVINIITKKGGSSGLDRPKVSAQLTGSYVEMGKYGGEQVPAGPSPYKTENSLTISGGSSGFSYSLGATANKTWSIMKDNLNDQLSFSGAARTVQGPFTIGLSAKWSQYNKNIPSYYNFWYENENLFPRWKPVGYRTGMAYDDRRYENYNTMYGLNIIYQPTDNWFNKIDIGRSGVGYENFRRNPYYLTLADSFVNAFIFNTDKSTYRYNTSYRMKLNDQFSINLSGGAEYTSFNYNYNSYSNIKFNANADMVTFSNTTTYSATHYTRNNSSVFATADFGYLDKLYFSISASVLHDPIAYEKTRIVPPRYGITFSDKLGRLEYRLRGLYGGTSLPVNPSYVNPVSSNPALSISLPNPDLVSEVREGWEVGTDLYLGKDASISLTYFSEKGENVTSVVPLQQETRPWIYQYMNAFSMKSNGIEFQGNVNLGFLNFPSLKVKLVYTYTNNTYTGIDPNLIKYNASYQISPTGLFQVEDRYAGIPAHSGSFDISYDVENWGASLSAIFQGGARNLDYVSWFKYRYGNSVHKDAGKTYNELGSTFSMVWNGATYTVSKNTQTRSYYTILPLYFKFDIKTYYKISDIFTVFLNVNNLTNDSTSDIGLYMTPGRTTTLGIRINY